MYQLSDKTFLYKNIKFQYCINSHNTRGNLTERTVEIPLLRYALDIMHDPIEIGCVSPYYWSVHHKIYDLTDTHPSCENIHAKEININNQNIISISTIEHFNVDNYDIDKYNYIDPITYLKNIVSLSNQYFITFPLGYNDYLSDHVLNNTNINVDYIARIEGSTWSQIKKDELTSDQITYNKNIWYANSIAIIQNIFNL